MTNALTTSVETILTAPQDAPCPLDQTLAKLRAMGEWYSASAGPIDDWASWTWASAYACTDFAAFQPQLDEAMRGPVPDKRVHGCGLFSSYAWLMVTSALACYLLDRRVPDLAPEGIAFRTLKHASGEDLNQLRYLRARFYCLPADPAAGSADAMVVADEAALQAKFHQQVEAYLPPVMQLIQANTGYLQRAMWGQVSDWVIGAAIEYTRLSRQPCQLDLFITQFAKRDGSPIKQSRGSVIPLHFDHPTTGEPCLEPMLDRTSCCQWYRFPEAKGDRCGTCPGLPREKRIERMTAYYKEECAKQPA